MQKVDGDGSVTGKEMVYQLFYKCKTRHLGVERGLPQMNKPILGRWLKW